MTHMPDPYLTHVLTGYRARALQMAQKMPANWLGRRLALLLRKIVLKSGAGPVIDAAVGPIRMRFHTGDNVSERKFLFTPQFFDVFERRLIAEHLPPDGVFVDIGANAGIYSLWAAYYLTGGGRVLAFEPNPVMAERFIFNAMVNKTWGRIRLEKIGISDEDGTFTLYLDDSNLGGSSLVASGRGDTSQSMKIPCRPLLDALQDHNLQHIDILKIDIEGAEDKALIPFLKEADPGLYPGYIILENSPTQWVQDLPAALENAGYSLLKTTRMNRIYQRSQAAS